MIFLSIAFNSINLCKNFSKEIISAIVETKKKKKRSMTSDQ